MAVLAETEAVATHPDRVDAYARKALVASAVGYAMDGFDLLILGFMLRAISADLGLSPAEAASLATTGPFRLVRVHVMPNIVQSVAVMATLGVSSAVLAAAGLSFLGLGVQPPAPEWGLILVSGANYMNKAPWILFFPGLAICLTALSLNLIGDGLRDMSDPRGGRTS